MTQFFDNMLNPLLIRELRQFVRNKFIIVFINIYVVALVGVCLMTFSTADNLSDVTGQFLFLPLTSIVSLASFITVIMRTAKNTSTDRINEDLMFFSSMKPSTIVWGKILSGIIFTLLLMSITMPFITLAYMLRGLDLTMVVVTFSSIFVFIQLLNSMVIFGALNHKAKKNQNATMIPSWIVLVFIIYFTIGRLARAVIMWSINFNNTEYFLCYVLLSVELTVLFIYMSIVRLSSPYSNRLLPMRILLTSMFLISVAVLVVLSNIFYRLGTQSEVYQIIETITLIVLMFLTIHAVCEPDQWSIRIRRSLPKSRLRRIMLFPFCSGAACGIVWILMITLFIVILEKILMLDSAVTRAFQIRFENDGIYLPLITILFIMTFNYSITAMLIRSWFFNRFKSSACIGIILALLLSMFMLGTFGVYILMHANIENLLDNMPEIFANYSTHVLSVLNPMCDVINHDYMHDYNIHFDKLRIVGMITWTILLIILLSIWYSQRIHNFSPNFKEPLPYDEAKQLIQNIENAEKLKIKPIQKIFTL
ncbi:MAG: hypothetical protein LBH59_04110, partial [Planctomycetaceae bacterium]|nr:hypothetical protein [Planctomycetaceae bacterium]